MKPDEQGTPDRGASRRDFFKLMLAAASIFTVASLGSFLRFLTFIHPPTVASKPAKTLSWPRVKLVNIKSMELSKPFSFNYPLVSTPNTLIKLGVRAENGVGPDGDIVAYSAICQHLGCYFSFQPLGSSPPCDSSYRAPVAEGYCCCHGGEYDLVHGGVVIGGPPPRPVPQVKLEFEEPTGDIYAVGMGPPTIFGHGPPGTSDPESVLRYDLEGGEVVADETVMSG